ncbi:TlpA disulfide reductase family protein [Hymenobacter weizhouensis]|uniref:TlpA disulfide reductase family protein n=1 Tax=Hymenobacter sp. YIM 151500-1 TaxID=2987689 RepID=UPI002225E661|nr:TlpA disulfide reductase family protein [Hymenobacter sp. YIM 151500-1]UYZ64796.1 TlpA family protein disulfide reductase [Hymenobacter sp. YIM 151500-1]
MSFVSLSHTPATLGLGLLLTLAACQQNSSSEKKAAASAGASSASPLTVGTWRGVLSAQDQEIPFLFEVDEAGGEPVVTLRNGEERLLLNEIKTAGDSTTIRLGVFDAALVVRPAGEGKLQGAWVKYDGKEPYRVPFAATKGEQPLFGGSEAQPQSFAGTWRVAFKGDDGKTYPAVGVFEQQGSNVTGTFLTSTGDYRYLAGQAVSDKLNLTTFDGSHGFLFTAQKRGNGLNGHFYSGKSGHETWTATLDPNAKLPDANALTGMKPGQKKLDFRFPNVYEGGSISPSDPKYRGKVLVVQILGSWCPNCMDETNFLAPWYEKNKGRGVEIIGLGFERTSDQKVAAQKLLKMKDRLNVGYDLAVAGEASKDAASAALPQIQKVLAFPTTIFLDKKGEVRKIHTGFSGPGTGKYYEQEVAEFNRTIDQLLTE